MFKPRSTWLRFKPADGMHVLARGRVSLYEARGEFQLIVEHLEEAGEGALRREFEQLKARLAAEGLFDAGAQACAAALRAPHRRDHLAERRRDPRRAERARAALSAGGRRDPAGARAGPRSAGRRSPPRSRRRPRARRHDVLLLTRGGGSLEDLWAFNDEALARAIRASAMPVVSAIGHEIDFTIADFVADLRAPTPSAAAELLVPDASDLLRVLARQRARLRNASRASSKRSAQTARSRAARLQAQRPQRGSRAPATRAVLERRLRAACAATVEMRSAACGTTARAARARRIRNSLLARRRERTQRFARPAARGRRARGRARALRLGELARTLNAVSPLATLDRGYAILFDRASGRVVRRYGRSRRIPRCARALPMARSICASIRIDDPQRPTRQRIRPRFISRHAAFATMTMVGRRRRRPPWRA